MRAFELKKHSLPTPEQGYAQLVGNSKDNQIVEIPIRLIDEIDNQPHKIHEEQIQSIADSIAVVGQIDPVIVVEHPDNKDRYILLSGRHRVRACEQLKMNTVKAVIMTEKNPDKQRFILISSNNDRNADYLPSELAYAFLEQKQLLKKLGSKQTTAKIAESTGTNRKSVHKFIQLTKLTKPLLYRVDKGEITVGAGYELSFMNEKEQESLNIYLVNNPNTHITKDTARLIRENPKNISEIINLSKQQEQPSTPPQHTNHKKTDKPTSPPLHVVFNNAEVTKIAENIFEWYSADIINLIIQSFASTDRVVAYLHQLCLSYTGFSRTVAFENSTNVALSVSFEKNKCKVRFNNKEFSFTLKEIDTILREYISTQLSVNTIIEMLKKSI